MLVLLCALWCSGAIAAQAQGGLRAGLIRPIEGETYYAGPTSVVYSIKIDGWVAGAADPRAVRVQIEIVQGGQVVGTIAVAPEADGTFLTSATVNPNGAHGDFGPVEVVSRCDECHYRAEVDLPNGALTLRLTATAPDGQQARLERRIVVDRADSVSVPVRVEVAGQPELRLGGLPVGASTRIYLWRARHASAATDASGVARLEVETPSQSTARYVFRVEPVVIGGVHYAGTEAAEVELKPGQRNIAPITLTVRARKGSLTGTISPRADVPLSVRAIRLPDGVSHTASVNADGTFHFAELPIAPYLIAPDGAALAAQGWSGEPRTVDLAQEIAAKVALTLERATGGVLHGTVRDETGAPLPFAWLSVERTDALARAAPSTGEFAAAGIPSGSQTLIASAPGYYSQAQVASTAEAVSIALAPRPETRRIAWGQGTVVIPPESDASVSEGKIVLAQGWLWGRGGTESLAIGTDIAQITIARGTFAIEQLTYQVEQSPLYRGWLVVLDGEAVAEFASGRERLRVGAGQMVALTGGAAHSAVPYDASVLDALRAMQGRAAQAAPYALVWEPTPEARLRDGLARAGINTAQAIAFVTYSVVVLSLALVPLLGVLWFRRRRQGAAGKRAI